MVFIALDHPGHPVEDRGEPRFVVRQRVHLASETVRLVVRLVDDVEAEDVAHIVELIAVRVVARADRVDIRLFHQTQVEVHILFADRVPGEGIVLVAVDPLDQRPLAVDLEQAVFHLGGAKTGDEAEAARRLIFRADGEDQRVEPRLLGRPFFRVGNKDIETHLGSSPGTDTEGLLVPDGLEICGNTAGREGLVDVVIRRAVGEQLGSGASGEKLLAVVADHRLDVKGRAVVPRPQLGGDFDILQKQRRAGVPEDLAIDAG